MKINASDIQFTVLKRRSEVERYKPIIGGFFKKLFDYEIELSIFKDDPDRPNRDAYVAQRLDSVGVSVLATVNNRFVGVITTTVEQPGMIEVLFVEPEFRRLDVGGQLVDQIRKAVGGRMTVACLVGNPNAIEFFKDCGFAVNTVHLMHCDEKK